MIPTLVRWLSRRSLRSLHALGVALGWLAMARVAVATAAACATTRAQAGVAAAAQRAAIAEAGRMVAELPWLWLSAQARPISRWARWEGEELVDAALAQGRGLVFLTPHLGCFEVTAQAYAERFGAGHPVTVLYRPARKAWLRELEETARARPGLATAPATLAGVRQMIRALRHGETVGLLPDQVPPHGMGVWAPFFGRRPTP